MRKHLRTRNNNIPTGISNPMHFKPLPSQAENSIYLRNRNQGCSNVYTHAENANKSLRIPRPQPLLGHIERINSTPPVSPTTLNSNVASAGAFNFRPTRAERYLMPPRSPPLRLCAPPMHVLSSCVCSTRKNVWFERIFQKRERAK